MLTVGTIAVGAVRTLPRGITVPGQRQTEGDTFPERPRVLRRNRTERGVPERRSKRRGIKDHSVLGCNNNSNRVVGGRWMLMVAGGIHRHPFNKSNRPTLVIRLWIRVLRRLETSTRRLVLLTSYACRLFTPTSAQIAEGDRGTQGESKEGREVGGDTAQEDRDGSTDQERVGGAVCFLIGFRYGPSSE